MANDSGVPSPLAGNGGTTDTGGASPLAGNGAPTVNPPAGNPGSGNPQQPQMSLEDALEALRKERLANGDAREKLKRLKEFEDADQKRKDAELTDQQRSVKERDDAVAALQSARADAAEARLTTLLQAANAIDADLAVAYLTKSIEYGKDGRPTNLADLVAQLQTDKAHFFTQPGQPQAPARPAPTSGGAMAAGRTQAQQAQAIRTTKPLTLEEAWRQQTTRS